MMQTFTCDCGWSYVIGKRQVYGPIWSGNTHHMMTRAEFVDEYGHCALAAGVRLGSARPID